MLTILDQEHLDKVKAFAEQMGLATQLQEQLDSLARSDDPSRECIDWAATLPRTRSRSPFTKTASTTITEASSIKARVVLPMAPFHRSL